MAIRKGCWAPHRGAQFLVATKKEKGKREKKRGKE